MFGICPVHVRYMFGLLPKMYRAHSEEIADKDAGYTEAVTRLRYRKSVGRLVIIN